METGRGETESEDGVSAEEAVAQTMLPELNDYDWAEVFKYAGEPTEYGNNPEFPCGHPHNHPVDPVGWWGGCSVDEHKVGKFGRADVAEIIAKDDGERDENDWLILVRLHDGRFGYIAAGCDYTGWGCQETGHSFVSASKEDIIRFAMTNEERQRLGVEAPDA